MGFFSDLLRGKERPPSPLHQWGLHGPYVTRNFIHGQKLYDQQQRRGQLRALDIQERALRQGFKQEIRMTRKAAKRGAAARGLGKSTLSMAIGPTMQLRMQRQQGLAGIKSTRATLPRVPGHFYTYMGKKAKYGALEPWQSYLSQGGRSGGLLGTVGTAVGGYFGGPIGASIGGRIGNMI